jgi:glycosyltransferase involved in cell wall biosynthesis
MVKSASTVSIVIPCFNMGAYVEDSIKSVYGQDYKDYEILVVNDGSTDESTIKKLEEIETKYPKIRVLNKSNSGLAGARNYGIERATGKYIVCLDADDKLDPKYLSRTVPVLEKDITGKIAFVTTWLQEFGARDNMWRTSGYDVPKLLSTNIVHAGSIFRKRVWKEVGGYKKVETGGYEDWEFWLSIVEKDYRWDIVEAPLFMYRIRTNSMLAKAKGDHIDIYQINYDLHPQLYAKYGKKLILENAKELKELRDSIAAKNEAIEEYEKSLDYYRNKANIASEKLEALYSSRITLWALELIKVSIFIRTKPRLLKAKAVSFVRSLVPAPVKRAIKKTQRILFPIKVIRVNNAQWREGTPLVSVVTPFYNQGEFILETIESVLNQTYQLFEYIIVDDGSKKEDAAVLDTIKDKRVKVIHLEENIGKGSPAAARNLGISKASGKYIVCLDSDDKLDPTYLEKGIITLETYPSVSLVTTDTITFGAKSEAILYQGYDPKVLIEDNRVITAAMYKKEAWLNVGGYKAGIGYEDWEFWINLAENGFFGRHLSEKIFYYRIAHESRYTEDKKKHSENLRSIRSLHPKYRDNVKKTQQSLKRKDFKVGIDTAFINLKSPEHYIRQDSKKRNVLVAVPWMTFGGAETLIVNFCREIQETSNLSFVTGLESAHEWEEKFKAISANIYHLTKLFNDDRELKVEFLCNYIETRNIELLHIIHTSFMFELLPEIKKRLPGLKIIVTLFNDRAEHFELSIDSQEYIGAFSTDNNSVAAHLKKRLGGTKPVIVIPNGIDCYDIFNPELFNRDKERQKLGIRENDLSVYFIGRLSEEKNPDIFLNTAKSLLKENNIKFFIIGDGVMRFQLEKMIKDMKLENVQYLGYQSDIARYLSTADIFVLPSSIEGFPLSILEAMAMEVVPIASDVGAVSEVVSSGKDGFVVSPGSAKEIREIIEILNNDRELLKRTKSKARAAVEGKYSNKILGENYTKLYKDV